MVPGGDGRGRQWMGCGVLTNLWICRTGPSSVYAVPIGFMVNGGREYAENHTNLRPCYWNDEGRQTVKIGMDCAKEVNKATKLSIRLGKLQLSKRLKFRATQVELFPNKQDSKLKTWMVKLCWCPDGSGLLVSCSKGAVWLAFDGSSCKHEAPGE